jgi:hypothetical protein
MLRYYMKDKTIMEERLKGNKITIDNITKL